MGVNRIKDSEFMGADVDAGERTRRSAPRELLV
jgi:hypothetical protein